MTTDHNISCPSNITVMNSEVKSYEFELRINAVISKEIQELQRKEEPYLDSES